MNNIKCEMIGILNDEKYREMSDISRRVYSPDAIAPSIHTCGGGNTEPKIAECVGGFGNKWGDKQYHQQSRIYKGDIALCHPSNIPGGSYYYMLKDDVKSCALRTRNYAGIPQRIEIGGLNANSLTSVAKDSMVIEPKCELPRMLDRPSVHEFSNRVYSTNGIARTLMGSGGNLNDKAGQYLMNNETATNVGEPQFRIRKLTPKECWRLMGFDDEDFDKASEVNSNSQLYKQAGNSIVVDVLEFIFKELIWQ